MPSLPYRECALGAAMRVSAADNDDGDNDGDGAMIRRDHTKWWKLAQRKACSRLLPPKEDSLLLAQALRKLMSQDLLTITTEEWQMISRADEYAKRLLGVIKVKSGDDVRTKDEAVAAIRGDE